VVGLIACAAAALAPSLAWAGDFDLDDDDTPKKPHAAPVVTVRGHAYTLTECLALTDRNHPNLWAARARLAVVHAQLDEAKWTPFSQWNANAGFGVLPPITGTAAYTSSSSSALNISFADAYQPFFHFDVSGAIPLYTFGKIDSIKRAAEANVRVNEWELEKWRQSTRMDVRRAYFGLMLARDAKYVVEDIIERLDKGIKGVQKKLDRGDTSVEETDRLRLEIYKEEIVARSGEALRGQTYALAALRFLTGVQTNFDIPDEPLKRPDVALGPVVRYLGAARIFRAEVNMARAGIAGRKALVDFNRAKFFPDVGIGLSASYTVAPSATEQRNPWVTDPFNRFGFGAAFGLKWNLDLLPNAARVAQAEGQLEESRAMERLALGGVAVEVENAYGTAVEAKGREESWARAEHRAKQWISTIQDGIDLGTKDERALMEPLRAYVNARVNHIYALMEINIALSDLARTSGWDSAAPTGS
jgi:outer membrane protein, multidrug efflux system